MKKAKHAIPKDHHTITPALVINGAAGAIDWYKKALDAKELFRMPGPDGKIAHASIKIGDSILYLSDPWANAKDAKDFGGSPASLVIYVKDCDAFFNKALENGGKVVMPMGDQFWGDRAGRFTDPFGYDWMVMTHKEDLTNEEIAERQEKFFSSMEKKQA